eukprot:Plantae.Rhodophyta-Palmaria_palmata.ctg15333.p2 GENE.Plantae.Rhodophyta-Palmaria_palmata.ctg15333~~Plantae.Rhodophyta-Palmaria_palmata.ctg15333.p2  ORF type:complete len:154 (+),score=29.87 Plantae.Rhodophyta-Palmaria_palmata.ctg15333:698-1159(+)
MLEQYKMLGGASSDSASTLPFDSYQCAFSQYLYTLVISNGSGALRSWCSPRGAVVSSVRQCWKLCGRSNMCWTATEKKKLEIERKAKEKKLDGLAQAVSAQVSDDEVMGVLSVAEDLLESGAEGTMDVESDYGGGMMMMTTFLEGHSTPLKSI